MNSRRHMTLFALLLVALAGCGTTGGERAVSGAGLGALGGYAVGAPAIGAISGAAAGAFTESDDIDLGEPIWDWD